MQISTFDLERWQSQYEHEVEVNLSESGVHPLRVRELVEADDLEALLGQPLESFFGTRESLELHENSWHPRLLLWLAMALFWGRQGGSLDILEFPRIPLAAQKSPRAPRQIRKKSRCHKCRLKPPPGEESYAFWAAGGLSRDLGPPGATP